MRIIRFIQKNYQPDLRALALMRILLALVVLVDLSIRCSDLEAHYSEQGLWPSQLIYNFGWQEGFWSIHALFKPMAWPLFLFVLHLFAAVFLLVGIQTQLASLLVWLLYVSLHNRNLFVLQAGDDLLRLSLFFGIFLSWGAYYSVDAFKNKTVRFYPFAGLAYLCLIASVYLFTVLLKDSKEWWPDGTALYYALSLEQLRLPFGDVIYGWPKLLQVCTYLVYGMEALFPVLILWPSGNGTLRALAFIGILILQFGIGLSLYVGLFFWISMAAAIGLLPGKTMLRLERLFRIHVKERITQLPPPRLYFMVNVFLGLVLVFCLALNIISLGWSGYKLKKETAWPLNALRLNQYWGMFSPGILKKDGWLVYYGIDAEGRQWDLRTNQDFVDDKKPPHIVAMYKNDRWRKLAENMQQEKFLFLRHLYGKYYLERWNREHPEKKMNTLNLFFMEQETKADYQKTEAKKILYCVSTQP